MRRFTIVLLIALLAFACATTPPTNDEAPVRMAMSEFMDALNALDLDRMTALFTDDITAFVPTAQPDRVVGRAAVTEIFRNFVARATARPNIVPEDVSVEVSGDLAVVTFQVRSDTTRRRTFIFRRVGREWKIAHFHASDVKG